MSAERKLGKSGIERNRRPIAVGDGDLRAGPKRLFHRPGSYLSGRAIDGRIWSMVAGAKLSRALGWCDCSFVIRQFYECAGYYAGSTLDVSIRNGHDRAGRSGATDGAANQKSGRLSALHRVSQ